MGCFINLHVDSNVTQLVERQIAHNTFVNAKGDLSGYDMGVYIQGRNDSTRTLSSRTIS